MNENVIHVLSIEDHPAEAQLIREKLAEAERVGWNLPRFQIEHVSHLGAALNRLNEDQFDVVLTDLDLPDSQADETVATLRKYIPHKPLVVLTGREDEALARKSVRAGVQDYLYKDEATGSLLARAMMYAIERQQVQADLERRVAERTADLRAEVAERKRAEFQKTAAFESLYESEKRFRSFFESAQIGVAMVNRATKLQTVNPFMCRWLGYDEEELRGLTVREITHPDDWERERVAIEALRDGKRNLVRLEKRYLRKNGDVVWGDLVTNIVYDGEGNYLFALGMVVDITARKVAEGALRESEESLRSVVENMPVMMDAFIEDNTVIAWNRECERVTGYPAAEIVGNPRAMELLYPDPEYREEVFNDLVELGFDFRDQEYTLTCKDGTKRTISWSNISARFPIPGWYTWAIGVDVTDQKRAERALQERMKELTCLYAVSRDVQEDLSVEELCRRTLTHLADAMQFPETAVPVIELDGRRYNGDHIEASAHHLGAEIRTRGEPRGRVAVHYAQEKPFLAEEQRLINVVAETLSVWLEHKMAEQELERYAAELERSNRDLERFGYVISHDLREPLRMVSSYLDLLKREYRGQLDETADTFIDFAVDGARRMHEMIHGLLDLSRVETHGKPFTPTDVEAVVAGAQRSLERAIEEMEATVTHDPLPTVMADETQLFQVFQNLIANAIKFKREGVKPRVHISAHREGEEWVFSVADNGIGIDSQYIQRIFEIFQRLHTEEEYPGLGIGLVLCKRIVERHGGRIWVESEVGQGSTFYFTLEPMG